MESVLKGYIGNVAKTKDWEETGLLKNLKGQECKEMSSVFDTFISLGGIENNLNLNLPILRMVFGILIDSDPSPSGPSRKLRNVIIMDGKSYKKPTLSEVKYVIDVSGFINYSNSNLNKLIDVLSTLEIDAEKEACHLMAKSWSKISIDFYTKNPKASIRNSKIDDIGILEK